MLILVYFYQRTQMLYLGALIVKHKHQEKYTYTRCMTNIDWSELFGINCNFVDVNSRLYFGSFKLSSRNLLKNVTKEIHMCSTSIVLNYIPHDFISCIVINQRLIISCNYTNIDPFSLKKHRYSLDSTKNIRTNLSKEGIQSQTFYQTTFVI